MSEYNFGSKIGEGGFCEVLRCLRAKDPQKYAVKILKDSSDVVGTRRFQREVRILASMDHPNVVRVVAKRLAKAPYHYIMPLYAGSLRDELEAMIGDEERVRLIFGSILDGVEYAHGQGVIHRDLKPENILMNSDTDLVVSDFGIGRVMDADSTRQTRTGFGMGTLFYMAPEQITRAKYADERSDVYALGRMLYELFTEPLTSAVQDTSSLSPGITLIVNKCTQQDPDRRFQSVSYLKSAWLNLFDATVRETEFDRFNYLRAQLSTPGTADSVIIDEFMALVVMFEEDEDTLHENIMQVHPEAVVAMYKRDAAVVKRVLERFAGNTISQNWGFDYTDKIGNRCHALYLAIEDYEIRAMLLECIMIVGIDHNRWHLHSIFQGLVYSDKKPGEIDPIVDRFEACNAQYRKGAAELLDLQRIPPALKKALAG